jgi:L-ribulose-5-phosphate 3-epimerase
LKNLVGVMQGRLLPKYKKRYQAHPVDYWQDEFLISRELDLDCIEFIVDYNEVEKNPLIKDGGLDEVKLISNESGVKVKTICADYFMEAPLHSENSEVVVSSKKMMLQLLSSASKLGVTEIVIPCVDQSSLSGQDAENRFLNNVLPLLEVAEEKNINFSLETDLDPKAFLNLLKRFNSKRIKVNYDIGNSAALGYNPIEELDAYGDKISDIHIKDRILKGGPVFLGQGNADFPVFFSKLKEFNYQGPFIMQAYRDNEGVEIFKKQLAWIKQYLSE